MLLWGAVGKFWCGGGGWAVAPVGEFWCGDGGWAEVACGALRAVAKGTKKGLQQLQPFVMIFYYVLNIGVMWSIT